MRKLLLIVTFLMVVAAGVFVFFYYQKETLPPGVRLYVGDVVVIVEIADSSLEQERGLSERDDLCEVCGMLFVFPNSIRRSFQMGKMRFPLDMIFINDERIVNIVEKVPAPVEGQDGRRIKVLSRYVTDMVLEVNGGWVEKNGVKIGDAVELVAETNL